jgi:hypothetical protein
MTTLHFRHDRSMTDLDRWHAFEAERPRTFSIPVSTGLICGVPRWRLDSVCAGIWSAWVPGSGSALAPPVAPKASIF